MFVSYLSILIFGPLATDSIKFLEKKLKKITMPNYKKKNKKRKTNAHLCTQGYSLYPAANLIC